MTHVLTVKIYDLGDTELADISDICLGDRTLTRPANAARQFQVVVPSANSLLTATATDGYQVLLDGNRKLVVWEDGDPSTDDPIFHGRIVTVERTGDGTSNRATITAFDPWAELGYEADRRAGRIVRGSTTQPTAGTPYGEFDGNFINPLFASSVTGQDGISGPDLIKQILTNSQGTDAESGSNPGEGPLPIDLVSGDWDLDVPSAVDVSPVASPSWPAYVGDFINLLVATNVVDFDLIPVRPGTGHNLSDTADPFVMVKATAKSSLGTDLSATVHFDYWTGSFNAKAVRHVADFTTICNKLYDYLGKKLDVAHWRANITPGTSGVTVNPAASRTKYGGPGTDPGEFFSIRFFDTLGTESTARPLYLALFNAELGLRVEPRDQLFITPNMDAKALYVPPTDFDAYDLVTINTGTEFGLALAETQRCLGYTKTWSSEGVATVSQLVTTADV